MSEFSDNMFGDDLVDEEISAMDQDVHTALAETSTGDDLISAFASAVKVKVESCETKAVHGTLQRRCCREGWIGGSRTQAMDEGSWRTRTERTNTSHLSRNGPWNL